MLYFKYNFYVPHRIESLRLAHLPFGRGWQNPLHGDNSPVLVPLREPSSP